MAAKNKDYYELLGVKRGAVAFVMPGITALILLILIAAWAIVTGIIREDDGKTLLPLEILPEIPENTSWSDREAPVH